jgi:pilus assembly protein FimV
MKRALTWGLSLTAALAMAGCPVFPDDRHACLNHADCAPGYECDQESGFCHAGSGSGVCSAPEQCGANETCGRDGQCHPGSCRIESTGCVAGFVCDTREGAWSCVPSDGGAPDASAGGAAGASGAPGAAGAAGSSGVSGDSGAAGAGASAGAAGTSAGGAAGATSGTGGADAGPDGAAGAAGAGAAS